MAGMAMKMPMPKKEGMTLGAKAPKSSPEVSGSVFDEYAADAFAAVKAGDSAGFKSALKSAIKACYADEE